MNVRVSEQVSTCSLQDEPTAPRSDRLDQGHCAPLSQPQVVCQRDLDEIRRPSLRDRICEGADARRSNAIGAEVEVSQVGQRPAADEVGDGRGLGVAAEVVDQ